MERLQQASSQPRTDFAGSPLTVSDQFVAGLGAGVAASMVACPTELIKCRLQAQTGSAPAADAPSTPVSPFSVVGPCKDAQSYYILVPQPRSKPRQYCWRNQSSELTSEPYQSLPGNHLSPPPPRRSGIIDSAQKGVDSLSFNAESRLRDSHVHKAGAQHIWSDATKKHNHVVVYWLIGFDPGSCPEL
jgi:hypothetical protein